MEGMERAARRPAHKRGLSWKAGLLICGAVILLIGVSLAALLAILTNRQPATALEVKLTLPGIVEPLPVNRQIDISAQSGGPPGAVRIEVYADGGLVLARDVEGTAKDPLVLEGGWTPATAGEHILLARAYTPGKKFFDSQVVRVQVAKKMRIADIVVDQKTLPAGAKVPSLQDIATTSGISVEELYGYNPGLRGSAPDAPIADGTRVSFPPPATLPEGLPAESPPPALPPPPAPITGAPTAPGSLSASASCAAASLSWADSPDEESYRVYRLGPGDAQPARAASLPANTTSFTDSLPPGGAGTTYRYQVAAVRGTLEGATRMVSASRPENCPTFWAQGTAPDLVFTSVDFATNSAWEGVFCYLSVNGQPFGRYPEGDFNQFSPTSADPKIYRAGSLGDASRIVLDGQPLDTPVKLRGECMGRNGPLAENIGTFDATHPGVDWNGGAHTIQTAGFALDYCLGPRSDPCRQGRASTTEEPPAGHGGGGNIDPNIPAPTNLRLPTGIDRCWQNPMLREDWLNCLVNYYSNMTTSTGTVMRGVPLTWDWSGNSSVREADLTGWYVTMRSINPANSSDMRLYGWSVFRPAGTVTLPRSSMSLLYSAPCGRQVEYTVIAVTASATSLQSDPLLYTTPGCVDPESSARVQVTFESVEVGDIVDEGEQCYFWPFPPIPICPAGPDNDGEVIGVLNVTGGTLRENNRLLAFRDPINPGTYSFRDWPTSGTSGGARTGNNVFETLITSATQSLQFSVRLIDSDYHTWELPGRSLFCGVEQYLDPRSIDQWKTINQPYNLVSRSGEANCTFNIRVNGVP